MPARLTACFLAVSGLGSLDAMAQRAPLTGEERSRFLEEIGRSDPDMPEGVRTLFADDGGRIDQYARCEVVDWVASKYSTLSADEKDRARDNQAACFLPTPEMTEQSAAAKLNGRPLALERDGDVLSVLMNARGENCRITGALQFPLERIADSEIWVRSIRLQDLDMGYVGVMPSAPCGQTAFETIVEYRGPAAPPAPPMLERAGVRGMIEETTINSAATGESRRLNIYIPPGDPPEAGWPTLYAADGAGGFLGLMVDEMIAKGEIRPILIVGVGSGPDSVVGKPNGPMRPQLRYFEYSRLAAEEYRSLFDRHMRFVAGEVTEWAAAQYHGSRDRQDRAVIGWSQGGQFAFWAGVLRPDVFSVAIPLSPGGPLPDDLPMVAEGPRARFFLSAGRYEPGSLRNGRKVEQLLRNNRYQVSADYPPAGHFQDHWLVATRNALREIFPPVGE